MFGFNPPLMQGVPPPPAVIMLLLLDWAPHTPLLPTALLLWLPKLLLPILLDPATEK